MKQEVCYTLPVCAVQLCSSNTVPQITKDVLIHSSKRIFKSTTLQIYLQKNFIVCLSSYTKIVGK
jgi:hypothetical protein